MDKDKKGKCRVGAVALCVSFLFTCATQTADAGWLSGVISKIEQKVDSYGSGQKATQGKFQFSTDNRHRVSHEGTATSSKAHTRELAAVYSFSLAEPSSLSFGCGMNRETDGTKISYGVYKENGSEIVEPTGFFLKEYRCVLPAGKYSVKVYIEAPFVGKTAKYSISGYRDVIPVNAPQNINTIAAAEPISLGKEIVNCWYETDKDKTGGSGQYQYYSFQLIRNTNIELKMNTLAYLTCKCYLLDESQNVLAEVWEPFDAREQSKTSLNLSPGIYYIKAGDFSWMPYKFSVTAI